MTKPLVVVGMSGGVDSSVAAALLVEQGYSVVGMMLRLWSEAGKESENRCCTPDDVAKARRVSAQLGIPFYVLDARDVFRNEVVESFLDGYARGGTPNPCIICNRKVRWGFLLTQAQSMGAEFFATGHYVQVEGQDDGQMILKRGRDAHKDQSYVLSMLNQEQLSHSLFPLGQFTKAEVRDLARRFGLVTAEKPESQDLCFLGAQDYRDFLRRHLPEIEKPGPITDVENHYLGEHQGLAFYTIGQRKGLGISSSEPMYVVEKDLANNRLVVGNINDLGRDEMLVTDFHWINDPYQGSFEAEVKIRYRADPNPAVICPLPGGDLKVHFTHSLRDITPGQIAAVYQGDIVVGGGIISQEKIGTINDFEG